MKTLEFPIPRRQWMLGLAAAVALPGIAHAAVDAATEGLDNERWRNVRRSVFGDRAISDAAAGIVELDLPVRAADASVVPIALRTKLAQTPERYIQKLYLVIDRNPSPLGATFTFTPDSGRAEIETRVRVEEYTHVRAIAEMNDGSLYMTTRFIKASGGCSAPAGKDVEEAKATLGRMKLRVEGDVLVGQPSLAQLSISHPNISGMGIDQLTRLAPAPEFVRSIEVSYAGQPVLTADVDFTISENPNIRFYFVPHGDGELRARIVDNSDRSFESKLAVRTGKRANG